MLLIMHPTTDTQTICAVTPWHRKATMQSARVCAYETLSSRRHFVNPVSGSHLLAGYPLTVAAVALIMFALFVAAVTTLMRTQSEHSVSEICLWLLVIFFVPAVGPLAFLSVAVKRHHNDRRQGIA